MHDVISLFLSDVIRRCGRLNLSYESLLRLHTLLSVPQDIFVVVQLFFKARAQLHHMTQVTDLCVVDVARGKVGRPSHHATL